MSVFYYANNEILSPAWRSPESRRFPWGWVLGLVLLGLLLGGAGWYYNRIVTDENAKSAVVLVEVETKDNQHKILGSGIIIHPTKGYILTDKHLLWDEGGRVARKVTVSYLSGSEKREVLQATVEAEGQGEPGLSVDQLKNDWAILRVNRKEPLPYLALDQALDFQEEEPIKVYGFPLPDVTGTNDYGPSVKVLHGILSRVDRNAKGGVTRLTHDAKSTWGMSGGPVTRDGKVIGMNTMKLKKVDGDDPNENYAVPTFLLLEQIKNYLPEK